ncbi:MAG: hypothetical protein MJ244_06065 [Clostridia bacterium]|nr:hypothetical protein [Clostridia bacterium]
MDSVKIDSCAIAALLLDFNKKVFKEDYVSLEEIYEVRIFIQCRLNEANANIVILDELDERIFEERNGMCFFVGDKTGKSIDAYLLGASEFLCLLDIINANKKDIIKCIYDLRNAKLEKLAKYI